MRSRRFPPKGAQARRKADGLAGTVFVSSPKTDLVAVRWRRKDETGTLLYNAEQFAREWKLTGASAAKWRMRAGVVALAAMAGIGIYCAAREWKSIVASRAQAATKQQESAGVDGKSLQGGNGHGGDALLAAQACSRGADAFVRSIAKNGFLWVGAATPDERFSGQIAVYVAPGITTSVSDKLLIKFITGDGAGVYKRVELNCSYNSEENAVLKYWIADGNEYQ
jgi:hypothetical protein